MQVAKYDEWIEKDGLLRVESWASDGLTNEDIAHNMGIHRDTLYTWMKRFPDIRRSIKKGREPVIREVENALFTSAKGYEFEETSTEVWVDDEGNRRQKVVKHKRYSKPDTSAGIFLLKNYKPDKYRNYNEVTKRRLEADLEKVLLENRKLELEIASNDTLESKLDKLLMVVESELDTIESE